MITVKPCACGHHTCKRYTLEGIGTFYAGSGFTKEDAERIALLLNNVELIKELDAHMSWIGSPWGDSYEASAAKESKLPSRWNTFIGALNG